MTVNEMVHVSLLLPFHGILNFSTKRDEVTFKLTPLGEGHLLPLLLLV